MHAGIEYDFMLAAQPQWLLTDFIHSYDLPGHVALLRRPKFCLREVAVSNLKECAIIYKRKVLPIALSWRFRLLVWLWRDGRG